MNVNRWIGTSLMLASLVGSTRILSRRRQRDTANRTVMLAVDYDDCQEVSIRSGITLGDLLHELWHRGASHIGITEQTLGDLLDAGSLIVAHLPSTHTTAGSTYVTAQNDPLLDRVATALAVRVPALSTLVPQTIGDRRYLAIPGTLQHLRSVTVGFEPAAFQQATAAGLVPVARPRHYPWPRPAAIDTVLSQAAALGSPLVAFAGSYVLGHEMFMHATIEALGTYELTPVYFAESRHQKGDWFIAKARLPHVVLGHEFTPGELDLEDEHGMAHKWGRMADRGVRFFSVRTMRGVHATDPLSLREYIGMVLDALINERGLRLAGRPDFVPASPHQHHGHSHHHHTHAHGNEHEHAPAHAHEHTHGHEHSHDHAPLHDQEHAHEHPHEHKHAHDYVPAHEHEHAHEHSHDHAPVPEHEHLHSHTAPAAGEHPHGLPNSAKTRSSPDAEQAPAPGDLQWVALAAAGAGGVAAAEVLGLPEPWASLLTMAAAGVAWVAVPLVDRPRNQLEESFPPSYAPKTIGLGLAVATPVAGLAAAGLLSESRSPAVALGLLAAALINGAGAAGLAASVAGEPYLKHVEEFRSYNLDWAVPLGLIAGHVAGAAWRPQRARPAAIAGAGLAALGAWLLTKAGRLPADLLGPWTYRPLHGHTHHLSAFQARLGDVQMAVGPQPLSKWGWLLPAGGILAATTRGPLRTAGLATATLGSVVLLAPLRQGAPALDDTLDAAVSGLTVGLVRLPVETLWPGTPPPPDPAA